MFEIKIIDICVNLSYSIWTELVPRHAMQSFIALYTTFHTKSDPTVLEFPLLYVFQLIVIKKMVFKNVTCRNSVIKIHKSSSTSLSPVTFHAFFVYQTQIRWPYKKLSVIQFLIFKIACWRIEIFVTLKLFKSCTDGNNASHNPLKSVSYNFTNSVILFSVPSSF